MRQVLIKGNVVTDTDHVPEAALEALTGVVDLILPRVRVVILKEGLLHQLRELVEDMDA